MKLLFDQNLSRRLVAPLLEAFPLSEHVTHVGLDRASDEEVWEYAKAHGFVIVSKDSDFHQRSFLFGAPPKVIWLRVGNCSTTLIHDIIIRRMDEIIAFDRDQLGAFLVLS